MTEPVQIPIVDFHVHVFPNSLAETLAANSALKPMSWVTSLADRVGVSGLGGGLIDLRKRLRELSRPLVESVHQAQPSVRHLPELVRSGLDALGGLLPLPGLLLESTEGDLGDQMSRNGVTHALVVAHPPTLSNEMVLDLCQRHDQWFPAVSIPKGVAKPAALLKQYVSEGARVLKIHPSADGEGVESSQYRKILKTACELDLPVILHSGCFESKSLYRGGHFFPLDAFSKWFESYRGLRFVIAHMNFHEPGKALDLCEDFGNLSVDTSWQPAEVIGEAVRRIGPERVLFASDWPFVGNNMEIALRRVKECQEIGLLKPVDAPLILGENALRILKIKE